MNRTGTSGLFIGMLAIGLLGLLLSLSLTRFVLHQVIVPRATLEKKGWWTQFSSPSRRLPVDGYEVFLPAEKTIALNPDIVLRYTGRTGKRIGRPTGDRFKGVESWEIDDDPREIKYLGSSIAP